MNSNYVYLLVVLLVAAVTTTIEMQAAYATSHYQIGYNDGCAGNVVPARIYRK